MFSTPAWQLVRDQKLADRSAALASADAFIPDASVQDDLKYLQASAPEIVHNIKNRVPGWTATSVLQAYIRASRRSQEKFNCLTDALYKDALKSAAVMDKHFEASGTLVGPLHGVPISLKDQLCIKGLDSTLGTTKHSNAPAEDNAFLVDILVEAGAIPFVKTNVPQTMLSFECQNPIYGATSNPHNTEMTSGGSSGGEAALLASDGSPLGIGSDIGGSLRIPAHYSGCYALKTTSGRIPTDRLQSANPGYEGVKSVLGPMGRTVGDLELAARAIIDVNSKSTTFSRISGPPCAPLAWRDEIRATPGGRIGYYKCDTLIKASPACRRAVEETVDALTKKGYTCVEIDPPDAAEALRIFTGLSSSDGYKNLLDGVGNDPKENSIYLTTLGPSLNFASRAIGQFVMSMMDPVFSTLLNESRTKTVSEYHLLVNRRNLFDRALRKRLWKDLDLDAVICPIQAVPALEIGKACYLAPLAASTIVYNVVDSSAGAIPVTTVDKEKDQLTDEWWNNGESQLKMLEERTYKKDPLGYDPNRMHGQPVGIQVICAGFEEEKVIDYMKIIDDALGPRDFGPGKFAAKNFVN